MPHPSEQVEHIDGSPLFVRGRFAYVATVGSQAHGTATAESDWDQAGVYIAPTLKLAGMDAAAYQDTVHGKGPAGDWTMWEVGTFCKSAMVCNPTVTELLFTPPRLVTKDTPELKTLRFVLRSSAMSERPARAAFAGFADSQRKRMLKVAQEPLGMRDVRYAKHVRHMFRVALLGIELLTTGTMTVEMAPDHLALVGAMEIAPPDSVLDEFAWYDNQLLNVESCLPAEPDKAAIAAALEAIRLGDVLR